MGEIADMYLSGELCQDCGAFTEGMSPPRWWLNANEKRIKAGMPELIWHVDPPGYPRLCEDCEKEDKRRNDG